MWKGSSQVWEPAPAQEQGKNAAHTIAVEPTPSCWENVTGQIKSNSHEKRGFS